MRVAYRDGGRYKGSGTVIDYPAIHYRGNQELWGGFLEGRENKSWRPNKGARGQSSRLLLATPKHMANLKWFDSYIVLCLELPVEQHASEIANQIGR